MSLIPFLINQNFVFIEHDSPTNFHPTDTVCILVFWFLFIITSTNTYKHEVLYCCCCCYSYHHIQTHKTHVNIRSWVVWISHTPSVVVTHHHHHQWTTCWDTLMVKFLPLWKCCNLVSSLQGEQQKTCHTGFCKVGEGRRKREVYRNKGKRLNLIYLVQQDDVLVNNWYTIDLVNILYLLL